MTQQQLREFAAQRLPTYLSNRFTPTKTIRRNNLRQGQRVIAITKDAANPFFFVGEILGFASFHDIDRTVCRAEKLIPTTLQNQPFYEKMENPVFQMNDDDDVPDPVFFCRSIACPVDVDYLEESVREYDADFSTTGLSDGGFDAFVHCEPIMIVRSLRRIQRKYILLQRHSEFDHWMNRQFSTISFFELTPKSFTPHL